jgi:3',5'-cyclic AMP phosphodiesterase CpdA
MLICQLTDLHVRPPGIVCNGLSDTNALTRQALRAVTRLSPQPDVLLITGDLAECGLPGEYEHLAGMLRGTISLPIFVIPGNHDCRDALRSGLAGLAYTGDDPVFVHYAVEDYPVRLVMLDTLVPGESHGSLSAPQLEWLDRTLAAQPNKPTLVAMHHPPFTTGLPHMDRISFLDAQKFRAVIARHPQVERIISGHHHRPIVGRCGHAIASVAPSVAHQVHLTFDETNTGAFTFEPPAIQLHAWNPADGFVTHTVYTGTFAGPFPFANDGGQVRTQP